MKDVICCGQAVLDCITRGKEKAPYRENVYRAESVRLSAGGDAVNESITLAGMGVRAAVVCGLGDDIAGRIVLDELRRAGVDTERISAMSSDTPIANIQVETDGSRISVNSGATRLPGYRIAPESLRGARIVSFASLFRPPLEEPEVIRQLIAEAKKDGTIVCADTKLPLVEGIDMEILSDVWPLVDFFFPNEKEAAFYTGKRELPEMADALYAYGIRNVIIKAGKEGCYLKNAEESTPLPAVPVETVRDTTGAGDALVSGCAAAMVEGFDTEKIGRFGSANAAFAIESFGATTGLKPMEDVLKRAGIEVR